MNAAVYFQHTSHGWRVSAIRKSTHDGAAYRSRFDSDELVITGNPQSLRVGQFCARPHKVMPVKEFWK